MFSIVYTLEPRRFERKITPVGDLAVARRGSILLFACRSNRYISPRDATPTGAKEAIVPTYEIDGPDAYRFLKKNPAARWYQEGADRGDPNGVLAFQRMERPFFEPRIVPGFSVRRKDRIFAIGSCFARGIEKVLMHKGFTMESAATEFDAFELRAKGATPLGFTNKYTTWSILNELRWALDPDAHFPDEAFVQISDTEWVDPHTNPTLQFVDLERTRERRRIISDVTARIAHCQVAVITLGLIETWLDRKTGLYMNMAPIPAMVEREPGRWAFHVLDYDQNRHNLEAIHQLLTAHGDRGLKIVVTVSPVPLMATFTDRDVVVANTYSKSLLRTAAEEWAAAHENVHYFPSYEIALNSDRGRVWTEDGRHVEGKATQHIMRLFTGAYVKKGLKALFGRK